MIEKQAERRKNLLLEEMQYMPCVLPAIRKVLLIKKGGLKLMKMMKRFLVILLAFSLLAGNAVAVTAAEPAAAHQIEKKTFPFCNLFPKDDKDAEDSKGAENVSLFFVDGADDLPFVELNDWAKLMTELMNQRYPVGGYQLTAEVQEEENKVILQRENENNTMVVDFNQGTVSFWDYLAFIQGPSEDFRKNYMNSISIHETDDDGQPYLLQLKESRNLFGDYTVLDLKKYEIPISLFAL